MQISAVQILKEEYEAQHRIFKIRERLAEIEAERQQSWAILKWRLSNVRHFIPREERRKE